MTTPKLYEEKELKFDPPPGFQLPAFPGEPLPIRTFTSTYFDTVDLRLVRAGLTLRRRVEHKKGLWQLKLPKGGSSRLEIEAPGGPSAPPDYFTGLIFGVLGGRPLQAVAKMRTRRTGIRVMSGVEPVAEVVFDSVLVYHDAKPARSFEEIEVELTGGGDRDLKRLSKHLIASGARPAEKGPKLFRALGLSPNKRPGLDPDAPDIEILKEAFAAQVLKLQQHDPGLRLGEDPEDLHQFRVAARRVREIIKAAGPLVDQAWAQSVEAELKWMSKAMNEARDLDVMIEYLEKEAGDIEGDLAPFVAGLLGSLKNRRAQRRKAVGDVIDSERYLNLMTLLESGPVAAPDAPGAGASLKSLAGKRFLKLAKAVSDAGDAPAQDSIHRLRIRGKRSRYAAELAAPKLGKKAAPFIDSAKAFQDLLGDMHDGAVLASEIEAFAKGSDNPHLLFAGGRLFEGQTNRQKSAFAALPKTWKRLQKNGRALWS